VLEAQDGAAGLDALGSRQVDVALLDVRLPGEARPCRASPHPGRRRLHQRDPDDGAPRRPDGDRIGSFSKTASC
jgi:CheY-like chemotaxis protein